MEPTGVAGFRGLAITPRQSLSRRLVLQDGFLRERGANRCLQLLGRTILFVCRPDHGVSISGIKVRIVLLEVGTLARVNHGFLQSLGVASFPIRSAIVLD